MVLGAQEMEDAAARGMRLCSEADSGFGFRPGRCPFLCFTA